MENPFDNKLLLQYLSGAGAAISSGQPIGAGLDPITQQNIKSQNYMKIFQKMLSGKFGEGDKIVSNSKGTKIDISKMSMDALDIGGENQLVPEGTPNIGSQGVNKGLDSKAPGLANPFASSQSDTFSPADLAGLSPQDISSALSGVMSVEALKQKKMSNVVDSLYKIQKIEESKAITAGLTPSITISGTDIKLTKDQYLKWYKEADKDERTAAMKNFEYAQGKGFKGSFEEFQDNAKTTHQKDYNAAIAGGYEGSFNEWMLDMVKAGAAQFNFGETAERATAGALGRQTAKFQDPNYIQGIETNLKKSGTTWRAADRTKELRESGMSSKDARSRAQRELILGQIDRDVRVHFKGKKIEIRSDGWYVDNELIMVNPYAK